MTASLSPFRLGRRRITRTLCALLLSVAGPAWALWGLSTSPDGRVQVAVDYLDLGFVSERYPDEQRLYYLVTLDDQVVVDWSPLGVRLADRDCVSDLSLVNARLDVVAESYSLVHGKRLETSYLASELGLSMTNGAGDVCEIEFRVFDDGVAFRYAIPGQGRVRVDEEVTGFRFPPETHAYLTPARRPGIWSPSYESPYQRQPAGTDSQGDGFYYPALFELPTPDTFVLIHEAGLDEGYVGTRLAADARDRLYRVRFPSQGEGNPVNPTRPRAHAPAYGPWRVLIVADAKTLVGSDLVTHLSPGLHPVFAGDTEWIRPGAAAWSWWTQGTGTPALQRQYIDFAAEQGWPYVIVDANWSQWPDADSAVEQLATYGQSRGVGILLWYNSGGDNNQVPEEPRDRLSTPADTESELSRLAQWGVAGIKVDFFRSDKQARIAQYRNILETAARHRLVVDLHGSTPPRGWRREFPNLLSTEAVRGTEYYKIFMGPSAALDVTYVFTRNVVGSMDYTPLAFESALAHRAISYAHELATAFVFESALQTFAERADRDPDQGFRALFARFPYLADLLREMPTAWDDTRLIEGHPRSHAVIARRFQDRWYLAGINGLPIPRTLSLDLGAFADGPHEAELIADGDTPDAFAHSLFDIDQRSIHRVTMAPRGGFVLVLDPK